MVAQVAKFIPNFAIFPIMRPNPYPTLYGNVKKKFAVLSTASLTTCVIAVFIFVPHVRTLSIALKIAFHILSGNSEKNITAESIALLTACTAVVFTFSPHATTLFITLDIASSIFVGSSVKYPTILSTISRNPSQCLYSKLIPPANGFTKSNKISCQLFFKKFFVVENVSGIVFVKNPAMLSTAFPIAFFTVFQTFDTVSLAFSFVATNVTIPATNVATNVITNIVGFAAIVAFTSSCTAFAASSPDFKFLIAVVVSFITFATFNVTKPAPIAFKTLAIVSPLSKIQPNPSNTFGNASTAISLAFSTTSPNSVATFSSTSFNSPFVKFSCKLLTVFVTFSTACFNGVSNFSYAAIPSPSRPLFNVVTFPFRLSFIVFAICSAAPSALSM